MMVTQFDLLLLIKAMYVLHTSESKHVDKLNAIIWTTAFSLTSLSLSLCTSVHGKHFSKLNIMICDLLSLNKEEKKRSWFNWVKEFDQY